MTDWQAIRIEYEQGASQASLAKRFSVSRKAIQNHIAKERWIVAGEVAPATRPPILLPISNDARSIARIGLHQLSMHLQTEVLLDIKDHKLLSDALAQYVKVLSMAPQEQKSQDGLIIPLDRISPHTRMEISRLLMEDEIMQPDQEKVS